MNNDDKAKGIIKDNIYCTVATAAPDGKPWISPLFFAYDADYNIYWVSNKDALHSELIRKNPRVAIVIFDTHASEGAGTAVYMEAKAKELSEENSVDAGIQIFNERVTEDEFRIKGRSDVTDDGVWRIYKATHVKAWLLGEGEHINGQYVDKREDISLR